MTAVSFPRPDFTKLAAFTPSKVPETVTSFELFNDEDVTPNFRPTNVTGAPVNWTEPLSKVEGLESTRGDAEATSKVPEFRLRIPLPNADPFAMVSFPPFRVKVCW